MNKTAKKYYSIQITKRFVQAMDKIIGTRDKTGKVTAKSFGEIVAMSSSNLNRLRSSSGENLVTVEAIGRLVGHFKVSPHWLISGAGDMISDGAHATIEARLRSLEEAVTGLKKNTKK
jgi:hypothetical protein